MLLNLQVECPVCKNVLHPTEDSTSFNVRFSHCRRVLYFIAGRVLDDREDAEEAVRNCFFTASRSTPEFQDEGAFRSWLLRLVIDEALLIVRRQRELSFGLFPPGAESASGETPMEGRFSHSRRSEVHS